VEERNPDFADCPLYCADDALRPVNDCRECPVAQATGAFKTSCQEFLQERVYRGRQPPWSLERLIGTVEHIAATEAQAGEGGMHGDWTMVTARLVSIFRHERYKLRLIDDFNKRQARGEGA